MDIATDGRSALLSIDLNEVPTPSYDAAPVDAFSVVRSIHGALTQASGLPAEYPGEAGAGRAPLPCGLCGFPETRGTTVVCDGCERGFHLGCAEIRDPRGPRDLEDWICVECSMIGGPKKRWMLGAARLLDINALPPSDGDVDAFPSDELRSNIPDGALYEFAGQHAFPNKGNLQSDLLLQSLRDFILERGGFLGEDWHMEFKQPSNKSDWVPVYCAPDGKKFESVYDVAHYLGIMSSSFSSSGIERNVGPGMVHKLLPPRRRKKELARVLTRNSSFENQNIMRSKVHGELLYDTEALVLPCCDAGNVSIISKYSTEENVSDGSQNFIVELPVQYEDFFITSVGKVDLRMSYHDNRQIWPVGYRAVWHDRISGSFFHCEVSDGGDLGPVFKVRRCPCSILPIPNGATIIIRNKIAEVEIAEEKESYGKTSDAGYDKEDDILLLLLDPIPSELDFLVTKDDCFVQISSLRDDIGEFYVEGRSSSSVWRNVTQTLIDTCREVYKKSGRLQFCCRHNNKIFPKYTGKTVEGLERFCSASGPIDTPQIVLSDKCLETTCKSLTKWIDQDRFGLDVSFVQEIIETIPGSRACSRYQFLSDRSDLSTTWTVGSGLLLAINKTEQGDEKLADFAEGTLLTDCRTPQGRPLSSRLPEELAGDVLQVCEFLWRFREILGLKEPFSFEELEEELLDPWPCSSNHAEKYESYPEIHGENHFTFIPIDTAPVREAVQAKLAAHTYDRCNGVTLTKAHISLLKILIGELISKVVIFVDPSFDARESKSRRGRKKDVDNTLIKEIKIDTPAVNELTWPELARRYVLAVSSMSACTDSQEVCSREGVKVFRCLQGDGGVLCGSLYGVAGMEADALLVAEAERQISDPRENEILSMDFADSDASRACEPVVVNVSSLPEWAEALEPVRKLPTNVGTRIRKCIYDSLEKDPPEWARKVLEHSISKEVYKGNASGPTKKAVLSVLAELSGSNLQQKPDKGQKEKIAISVSDAIMRKCRFVLRCSVSADENKVFCNLLGTTLMNSIDGEDEGTIGFPAMVSRPLDFRTIDLRLAAGAYLGSHEVFLEDVHEVWHNILMAYGDRPDLIKLVETLVRNFESLYEKEVLCLVQKLVNYTDTEKLDAEAQKELHDILLNENEIPKAPWDEGVCKVCGIDKDDDSVLLCDTCDSEFHTYCLNPPLARIPEGNWYCPSCLASESKTEDACHHSPVVKRQPTRRLGEDTRAVDQLLTAMEEREYWDFSIEERIFLLKFLCDEALSSALLREHLEQCADKSNDLQQKLRSLSVEWRNLKAKEELLEMRMVMENTGNSSGMVGALREGAITNPGRLTGQQIDDKLNRGTFFSGGSLKRSYIPTEYSLENKKEELSGQDEQPLLVSSQGNDKEGEVVHGVGQENVERIVMGLENINHDSLDTKSIMSKDRNSPIVSNANIDPISYNWKDLMPIGSEINMLASEPLDQDLAFQGKHYNVHAGVTGYEPSDLETNSLKNEISHLQGTIASLESQLMMLSLRRDLLGRDSSNRLYWVIRRPGKRPWLVVDGSISAPWERKKAEDSRISVPRRNYGPSGPGSVNQSGSHWNQNLSSYCSMVLFESDDEIRDLVGWLGDTDPREKKLKKSILQWQKFGSHQGISIVADDPQLISTSLSTKSVAVLETKYGPFLEIETNEAPKKRGRKGKLICEERMHRCECLEPVWTSRYHCLSCHQTFCTVTELEGHNDGRCMVHALDESRESDESLKGKGARPDNTREKEQVSEIDTFETLRNGKSTMSSKLVKVGKRKCPYDFDEICKKFVTKKSSKELVQEIGLIGANGVPSFIPSPIHSPDPSLIFNSVKTYDTDSCHFDSGNGSGCINKPHHNNLANGTNEDIPKGPDQIQGLEVSQNYTIPESSLRPIVGKTCQILKRLKINLLDMEAALPEEALRPSKANLVKRCAWRAFVKSAESIFEMVQSTVVFEGMIKTKYLKNRWWHWSSLTAAAKTPTISSLALRIYTLDDCIMYTKESTKIVKKRKDMEV